MAVAEAQEKADATARQSGITAVEDDDEEEVDATGVEDADIDVVMSQVNLSLHCLGLFCRKRK